MSLLSTKKQKKKRITRQIRRDTKNERIIKRDRLVSIVVNGYFFSPNKQIFIPEALVTANVFHFLPVSSLYTLCRVCPRFKKLCNNYIEYRTRTDFWFALQVECGKTLKRRIKTGLAKKRRTANKAAKKAVKDSVEKVTTLKTIG